MFYPNKLERNKWMFGLFLLAGWTAFGIFFGTQEYIQDAYAGRPASLPGHLVSWILCGYTWALLTVPILGFARRFSLYRLGWSAFFLIHIPASAFFSSAALGLYVIISTLLFGSRTRSLAEIYTNVFVSEFQSEILVYFLIVSMATVYDRLFRARDQDVHSLEHRPLGPQPNASTNGHAINGNGTRYLKRISIKDNGRIALVETDAIQWIGSYGNYLKVHTAGARYIHRETMTAIEQRLDPDKFVRIRRSAIVRVEQVQELRPISNGEYEVVLKNATVLTSTRRYRKNLEALIQR